MARYEYKYDPCGSPGDWQDVGRGHKSLVSAVVGVVAALVDREFSLDGLDRADVTEETPSSVTVALLAWQGDISHVTVRKKKG